MIGILPGLRCLHQTRGDSVKATGRGHGRAPIARKQLAISAACPNNLTGLRDRALVLMHFAAAGREHELAFNRVRDSDETRGRIQADLRVSKVRPRIVPVPYGTRPSICPVRAWQAWKETAGLDDPDGYAWRRLHNRWHTVMEGGLQLESIADVITRAGEGAGIEIRFTAHGPRRGLATSSRMKGHDQTSSPSRVAGRRTPRCSPTTSKSSTSGRTMPCSVCCNKDLKAPLPEGRGFVTLQG
ncbi:hypothetical protein ACWEO4_48245 [Streptomyces sp. NPDC004393]|uniref:hypothetical protein n=1 Tax=Streptomyces sp. NPDC004533 TaxID=3154278 RepID=UPI0033BC4A28